MFKRALIVSVTAFVLASVHSTMAGTIAHEGLEFHFTLTDGAKVIQYIYAPGQGTPIERGTFHELRVKVDGEYYFYPSNFGGPQVELNGVEYYPWSSPGPTKEMLGAPVLDDNGTPSVPEDDFVLASFRWSTSGDSVDFTYRFSLEGKALRVEMTSSQAKVVSWLSDRTEDQNPGVPAGDPQMDPYVIPSLPYAIAVVRHPSNPVFAALALDLSHSQATRITTSFARYDAGSVYVGQSAFYDKDTNGSRYPSVESLSIIVSSNVQDLFVPLPDWTRVSSWRADLSRRVIYDNWLGQNWETDTISDLRRMRDHGLCDLLMILHVWQRWGYDVKLPDHLPPNPGYGGEPAMRKMLETAEQLGYRAAIHENYTDNYPDAPSYNPDLNALNSDGSFTEAWYNSWTGVQSFALKSAHALDVMKLNAPTIASFGVSAGFVDVLSAIYYGDHVDHDSNILDACKGRQVVEEYTAIMDYARTVYDGPFIGEGGAQSMWAGIADGVEGEITRLISPETVPWVDYPPVVDYDLLYIHPRMVNHGVGYHNRFFHGRPFSTVNYDTARATTLAFGRAGFIDTTGEGKFNLLEAIREYYLVRPIQEILALTIPVSISYEKDGVYRDLSTAILEDDAWRVRVVWNSDTTVWANRGTTEWLVTPGNGNEYKLPPNNGWLVWHQGEHSLIACSTASTDGSRRDSLITDDLNFGYVGAPQNLGAMALKSSDRWPVRDVHAYGISVGDVLDRSVLTTSDRGSSNLVWQNGGTCIYHFSESAAPGTTVNYSDGPLHWRVANGRLRVDEIEIWALDSHGARLEKIEWTPTNNERTISWTASRDVDYELSGPLLKETSVSANWALY